MHCMWQVSWSLTITKSLQKEACQKWLHSQMWAVLQEEAVLSTCTKEDPVYHVPHTCNLKRHVDGKHKY